MADQAEVVQSPEERLMALMGDGDEVDVVPTRGDEDAPEDDEPKGESETNEEVESEDSDDDSQEQPEEDGTLKLTHNGKEVEVPIAEAKKLAQQGYDYTQKTQALAADRKAVENYAHAIKAQEQILQQQAATQAAFIKEIAQIENVNAQLAQYDQVNWNELSDSDPVAAQKHWITKTQLENKRVQLHNEINQKQQQLTQHQAQMQEARLAEARAELLKAFPDWSAEKAAAFRDTAKSIGYTDQEIGGIVDPRLIKLLDLANEGLKFRNRKPATENKVQGKPPVVKPGAKDTKAASRTDYANTRQQLKKTGNADLAAKLIERML